MTGSVTERPTVWMSPSAAAKAAAYTTHGRADEAPKRTAGLNRPSPGVGQMDQLDVAGPRHTTVPIPDRLPVRSLVVNCLLNPLLPPSQRSKSRLVV